jgi:hypothetical protein
VQTTSLELDRSIADLNVSLIELGTELLPEVNSGLKEFAQVVRDNRETFKDLGTFIKDTILDPLATQRGQDLVTIVEERAKQAEIAKPFTRSELEDIAAGREAERVLQMRANRANIKTSRNTE